MFGERMESEIRQQPEVLTHGAESYFPRLKESLGGKSFDMVLLVARGSSDNAALYARYLTEVFLEIPVSLAAPSVVTRFKKHIQYPKCLAIGISQSGAAPDVAEVLQALRADGHTTVAITNTPGSRLTQEAEHSILLEAGEEKSVAATKTYSASLLALYELVRALGGDIPAPLLHLPNDQWLETALTAAQGSQGPVLRSNPVFALARGFGYSTAQETALKLMECALISCKAFSSADFEHGPKALAGPQSAAVCFDGPKPNLSAQGCQIVTSPQLPSTAAAADGVLAPLWDVIYGQWLALLCARARGLNPDDPQYIRKVTETV
ncbi:MAG TPA: SIS domain-containing protein [Fimbriimonas sp.]|nr:SIS domain-containing protein [Fimbriimonas sp.]